MFFFLLSFAAGVLSVFAACVLPLLPVIVGGSLAAGGSRRRMYVIVGSLAVSVVAFTLLLKASTTLIGVPEELWRYLSGGIVVILGIVMVFPKLWVLVPGVNALNRGSNRLLAEGYQRRGIWGDAIMGAALGPVFASCSPTYFIILATVLPAQPFLGFLYLIAYAAGLSLALLLVAVLGEKLVSRLGVTLDPGGKFFRGIGVVLVVVGVLIFTGAMKDIETWFIERGFDATFIELKLLGANADSSVKSDSTAGFIPAVQKSSMYKRAPELVSPDGYINTEGKRITLAELRGKKVVLLDVWTYSCINCQRTLPYLKDWYAKYKNQGLEIVAVHTPEFAFEKIQKNVETAVTGFGLTYPVVLDNDYRTWNAYGNQYWPRKYLIDIDGYIIYDHIGEGAYVETEAQIQRALAERAARLGEDMPEVVPPVEVASAGGRANSPETYFGAWRNNNLGNGVAREEGKQTLTIPQRLAPNAFYLGGVWNFEYEYMTNESSGAQLRFIYDAKDVYFVAAADTPVRIKVTRDGGKPLDPARGADVGEDGFATIQEERLYKLIQDTGSGPHTIEIEVQTPGLQAYTFTFG
ncbi:redoxin domain-containing protein [Candidatus Kaiserbacteria bacterium]|nr:redoxin domain-containing protein [Candidatus Kaiserbacteria bacterium]